MKRRYLLDTNHLANAVRRSSVVRQSIEKRRTAGCKIGTCIPVLCEVEAGIQQVSQPFMYRENLQHLLRQVTIWPIDIATAESYGRIHHDLRRRGRALSQVDIILAALAQQMDATLVTSDRDFEALSEVITENWLMPAS